MRRIALLLIVVLLMYKCDKTPSSYDTVVTSIFSVDMDESNVWDGDSVVIDSLKVVLNVSSTIFSYEFRWKIDDEKWGKWVEADDENQLTILSEELDAGEHTFTIKVRSGKESEISDSLISFFIAELPEISEESPTKVTVEEGADCTLWVAVKGTEPMKYEWFKDGDEIDEKLRDTLVLSETAFKETGEYVCKVSNRWGEDTSKKIIVTMSNRFTVTYKGNGNTDGDVPVDEKIYRSDDTVVVLDNSGNLEKEDYTFIGWNSSEDGSGDDFPVDTRFLIGDDNITLYARWKKGKPTWTVTYEDNGSTGGDVPEDEHEYFMGDTAIVLSNDGDLEKTGYTFSGWNTEEDGKGTTVMPGDTFIIHDADMTFFAQWTRNKYSVAFDSRGGDSVASLTVKYGDKADEPTSPEKEDDTFIAWYKDANCIHEWDFDSDTVTADITLFAKWASTPEKLELILSAVENGTVMYKEKSVSNDTLVVDIETTLTFTAVPSENYHLAFWRTVSGDVEWSDSLSTETTLSLSESSEISAVFVHDSVVLKVLATTHGKIKYQDVSMSDDSIFIPTDEEISLKAVPSENYRFAFWQTVSGNVDWSDSLAAETKLSLSERSEITAIFVIDSTTLKVQSSSNGTVLFEDADLPGDSLRVVTGEELSLTAVPDTNYHFAFWQTVSGSIDWSDSLSAEGTFSVSRESEIKAVFVRDSVTLNIQSAQNGSVFFHGTQLMDESLRMPTGESVTLTAVSSMNYHFTGWKTVSGEVDWSDSLAAEVTVSPMEQSEIAAVFEQDSFTLQIQVEGAGSVYYHDEHIFVNDIRIPSNRRDSIECIPNQDNWIVTGWETVSGTPTIFNNDSNELIFSLTEDATVKVVLEQQFNLTLRNSGDGYTSPSGTVTVMKNEVVSISAQEEMHSSFSRWVITDGYADIADFRSETTTVTLTSGDVVIEAIFYYKDTLWVPVTYYDFHSDKSNPEFECQHRGGVYHGMVADTLDASRKPVLGDTPYLNHYVKYWFRDWRYLARGDMSIPVYECKDDNCDAETDAGMEYTGTVTVNYDTAFKNVVIEDSLPFLLVYDMDVPSGTYRYENDKFFPLDGYRGFGNEGKVHNYSFTMELHWNFTYRSGLKFDFHGDDDVWAFINGKLNVDLGGIHNPEGAGIDLDNIPDLIEGEEYPLDFFYCERHTVGSSIRIISNVFRKAVEN